MKGDAVMSVQIGRITSKFQSTIPSEIREAVGAHIGDQVIFQVNQHREIVIRPLRKSSIDEVYGALHRENVAYLPLDEARNATQDDMAHQFVREKGPEL
ncbi:MAG: AbrB/MazE/SpoVT family DNA-binding domain-containing protein [Firmicutes bacterium]|nr:AbrB/MazE/SpoVT family DNA-binding domain-containing protein [Bacillota bacterium]